MLPSARPHRNSDGCWTCRLRKKKCDLGQPACMGCASLEIECVYGDAKPVWMDGGELQRERAELLKIEVKRRAATRRERRHVFGDLEGGTLVDFEMAGGLDGVHLSARTQPTDHGEGLIAMDDAATSTFSTAQNTPTSSTTADSPDVPRGDQIDAEPAAPVASGTIPSNKELALIVVYLDYVFPFLFPFYRPGLFSGGRGWLLTLIINNRALLHSSLSISAFFMAEWFHKEQLPQGEEGGHISACQTAAWEELQTQQGLSMQSLMDEVAGINRHGVKGRLKEGIRTLASIIQILCYDVAVGNAESWALHLDGAIVLLDQVLQLNAHSLESPDGNKLVCWGSLMIGLQYEDGALGAAGRAAEGNWADYPLSSDAAALQFFAAAALYFDIISSTTLEQPPRLASYHMALLGTPSEHIKNYSDLVPVERIKAQASPRALAADTPAVDLAVVSGAANWVLACVGQIAELDAWKKREKRQARLDVVELVGRAGVIERKLRLGLEKMDNDTTKRSKGMMPSYTPPPIFSDGSCPKHKMPDESTQSLTTRVWAHAALAYLAVVVNGWQPASASIRASVITALSILSKLSTETPLCMRAMGWPLAVTGCLATREQEGCFRGLVGSIVVGLKVFGAVNEAMVIIEEVWARREDIEGGGLEWDLSRCFGITGRRAFLV